MSLENSIEIKYKELSQYINIEYINFYKDFPLRKLQEIFSTLHSLFISNYDAMNSRLPTGEFTNHFWAENSRELILAIDVTKSLQRILQTTAHAFDIDQYYQDILEKSQQFLSKSGGSEIPPHMDKVKLYYKIPIFIKSDKKKIVVETPKIRSIDHEYIKSISTRAMDDVKQGNFDSAITKSRTLLEEVFCHVIERKSQTPVTSGKIGQLYKQAKGLYNMHSNGGVDQRVKKLLSGLFMIVDSISEMRNKNSDAHGVGLNRVIIYEYHTRLFVNAAMTMADFILSVANKANSKDVE